MDTLFRKTRAGRYEPATIHEVREAASRTYDVLAELDQVQQPAQAAEIIRQRLRGERRELFGCLWQDTRHRTLAWTTPFYGTIDGASVYPREVVREALHYNAAAVILAHNHPSGDPEPSQADHAITRRIREALMLIDVRVLDHVVVGHHSTVSLAERGLI